MREYEFRVFDISCGSTKEIINISRSGAWIVIDGAVNIPDPCHGIKIFPEMDMDSKTLRIHVKASKIKVFCIQCLAKARFNIKISALHLKQHFKSSKIKLVIDYYVRGRSAVLYDGELEL